MSEPIRVMMSFTQPTETSSPYVQLLIKGLEREGVTVEYLSWRKLLGGTKNLLHVHWPETMLQRRTHLGRAANRMFMMILLLRARLGLTRVVRTVHNSVPHETPQRVDTALLRALDALTHARIHLSSPAAGVMGDLSIVLPHAELGSWYRNAARSEGGDGGSGPDLLFFGLIRPYKGIDQLLRLAEEAPHLQIRIIGSPTDAELGQRVSSASERLPNVTVDLRHIPDADLPREIRRARLVVLPYERFENSGAAALAIDLGTPVLVPTSGPTVELREIFGSAWVYLFDSELTPATAKLAIDSSSAGARPDRPIIAEREWDYQAAKHKALYRSAYGATGRRR